MIFSHQKTLAGTKRPRPMYRPVAIKLFPFQAFNANAVKNMATWMATFKISQFPFQNQW
jgi:hypothetical protein